MIARAERATKRGRPRRRARPALVAAALAALAFACGAPRAARADDGSSRGSSSAAPEDPDDVRPILAAAKQMILPYVGLRGGVVDLRRGGSSPSVAFAASSTDFYDGAVNRRTRADVRLGEADGVEGLFAADLALGRRFDVEPAHGVVVRGGGSGKLFADDRTSLAYLEAPELQAGYQYMKRDATGDDPVYVAEVAAQGGLALAARAEADGARRSLAPAPAWGVHGNLSVKALSLEGTFVQIAPNGPSRASIDEATAFVCSAGSLFRVCADGAAAWTALADATGVFHRERIVTAGISLSISMLVFQSSSGLRFP